MIIGSITSLIIFGTIMPIIWSNILIHDDTAESRAKAIFAYTWIVAGDVLILASIIGICLGPNDTEPYIFGTLGSILGLYMIISTRLLMKNKKIGNKLISGLSWIGISVLGLFSPIAFLMFCTIPFRLIFYMGRKGMNINEVLQKESEMILVVAWTLSMLLFCIGSARFMKKLKAIDLLTESKARKVGKKKVPKFNLSSSGKRALNRIK